MLLTIAVRALDPSRTTSTAFKFNLKLGGRVNRDDVGSTAWERALATEFQVGAHGCAGQASSRSSGFSNRCHGSRRRAIEPRSDGLNIVNNFPSPMLKVA